MRSTSRWLWRFLGLGLIVALPLAGAVDQKISNLPAATPPYADTDEMEVNEAGTSRKVTVGNLVREYIAGNSGAAGAGETIQILTSACTANATTTPAVCMTTTGLAIGTWYYEYHVIYRSTATTTGVNLQVDYTGTVTRTRSWRLGGTALATAADGIADNTVVSLTGGVAQRWAAITDNGAMGPSTGVSSTSEDQYEIVRGILVVSTSANLELEHASEGAVSTQVQADTWLLLRRLN